MRAHIHEINQDHRRHRAALRFGKYFGTPPEYWLNLQHMHDLAAAREEQADALARIRPWVA